MAIFRRAIEETLTSSKTGTQSRDSPEGTQELYALWWTSKNIPDEVLEAFWIGYADYDSPFAAASTFKFQTVGGHWKGEQDQWLAEIEGAYQFGEFGDTSHAAGFFTIGVGRDLKNLPCKPVLWVYYDWASGDDTIGNDFNQLFPLGHKHLGYMDFLRARTSRTSTYCSKPFRPTSGKPLPGDTSSS